MRRLSFILGVIGIASCALAARFKHASLPMAMPKPMTWAEHIAEIASRTNRRRYAHWIQANICHGGYDHSMSPADAAERQASCAKICGLCRYIHSLEVWPERPFRRPPQAVLDALENQPYCTHEPIS